MPCNASDTRLIQAICFTQNRTRRPMRFPLSVYG